MFDVPDTILLEDNEPIRCGNATGADTCPDGYACWQTGTHNPDNDYTNFDTIYASFATVFRVFLLDFWEDVLHNLIATAGPWTIAFFIVLIFFITFPLLGMLKAVIALSYDNVKSQQWEDDLMKDLNKVLKSIATLLTCGRRECTHKSTQPVRSDKLFEE